jgi:ADP-heptose:LPS heptosyltransferase
MLAEINLIPPEIVAKAGDYFKIQASQETKTEVNAWFEVEQIQASAFKLGLFISASRAEKCWDYLQFLDFLEIIAEKLPSLDVIFLGGLNDEADKAKIFTAWETRKMKFRHGIFAEKVRIHWFSAPKLPEIVEIASRLDGFVSNDTGPYHLAVMSGVQTLGLFQKPLPDFFPPEPHKILIAPDQDMSKLSPKIVAAEFIDIFAQS